VSAAPLVQRLFRELADGELHSGAALAASHGVTRSAIWKAAGSLRELGAELESLPRRGYRLRQRCVPLDATALRRALSPAARERLQELRCEWSLASTNTALLTLAAPVAGRNQVCVSEHQSGGRGRRGRTWIAPLGGAICLSLSHTFAQLPRDISCLSLVVGVCALRALSEWGAAPLLLKWPNDLVVNDRKLGGILIEMRAEAGGPAHVVIGLGLNFALGPSARREVDALGTSPIDLKELGLASDDRNRVAAAIIDSLIKGLQQFEREGFETFRTQWAGADALRGREVTVSGAGAPRHGVAAGINGAGELQLDTVSGRKSIIAGDVSVRVCETA